MLELLKQRDSLLAEWRRQLEVGMPTIKLERPAPVVHLRPDTLAKPKRFATEWTDQEGCGAAVLDELAAAAKRDLEPPRYVELLRRFAREWRATEHDPKTREYVGGRFVLLLEVIEAFEEAELQT